MKIWIGVIFFSILIGTQQQPQNVEAEGENEEPAALLPLNPLYSTLNSASSSKANTQIHSSSSKSDTTGTENEERLKDVGNPSPATHSSKVEGVQEVIPQTSGGVNVPAALPKELSPGEGEADELTEIKKEEIKSGGTDGVPGTSKYLEPGVSERETFEALSLANEQIITPDGDGIIKDVKDGISLEQLKENENQTESPEVEAKHDSEHDGDVPEEGQDANKSDEDSIPSFSEWTKLQLAQRKESIINNIKDKTSIQEGKNFASPDCGAKVVASNPESQNPSGAISSSHDEYMLNRCTVNTWLVVELCEPLRIEKVALGNLELFSSSPNEFELGVTDRYPSRDWTTIGPFFAPAFRNLHSFQLPANDSTFGKFLRVVVKSHHGKEHYCPLSLIKVFGKSEYEVLESETTHAEDVEHSNSNNAVDEEEILHDAPATQSVIGSATEAVLQMVKKAADALVNNNVSEKDVSPTETISTNLSCLTVTQCIPETLHKEQILQNLSCKSHILKWLEQITSWCAWNQCHEVLRQTSIGSPWMTEGFMIALYGPAIIDTLCNFIKPSNSCDLRGDEKAMELTSGVPNDTQAREIPPQSTRVPVEVTAPTNGQAQPLLPEIPPPQVNPPLQTSEEPAQKESVFVRLSNRIKNLERNQSLSSGYLEELSRRFKKQSEEIVISNEYFKKALNESLSKCKSVEETLRYQVNRLTRNNENLRELVWRVELQRGGMVFFAVIQIIFTIIFWWRSQRRPDQIAVSALSEPLNPSVSSNLSQSDSALNLIQRKRSNSEQLKKVKKKKKKNDGFSNAVPNSTNGGLKFDFKAPPIFEPRSNSSSSVSTTTSTNSAPNVPIKSDRPTIGNLVVSKHNESQPSSNKKKSKLMSIFGSKN